MRVQIVLSKIFREGKGKKLRLLIKSFLSCVLLRKVLTSFVHHKLAHTKLRDFRLGLCFAAMTFVRSGAEKAVQDFLETL